MSINQLVEMSIRYGSDEFYVLAGGGNTSFKENGVMHVKGSGTALGTIKAEQFVAMDMEKLAAMLSKQYPADDDARESEALNDMMESKLEGEENKRPSVEAILHSIFPYKFVLHTHPSLVNGMSCGKDGEKICCDLFGDKAVWVPLTKPGYVLSTVCSKLFDENLKKTGTFPQIVILQNHGIFVSADTVEAIDAIMADVMAKLKGKVTENPDFSKVDYDTQKTDELLQIFKNLYSDSGKACGVFCTNKQTLEFLKDDESYHELVKPFTPDHIVYCKHTPLFVAYGDDYSECFKRYIDANGFAPKIVAVKGLGFFALGMNEKEAETAKILFLDAMKVAVYTRSFGGIFPLPDDFTQFILNWEIESYRQKVAAN